MPNRPAIRPMPTCTVSGMPSSRASSHSACTTWSWVNPGPRVASPIVISPSSPGTCVERTRRTSSPGISSALKNQYFSSEVFALP